jgi:hypothetical protein
MSHMRTTVTLDPEVAAKFKTLARQRGLSFKQTLNQTVREGLCRRRNAPLSLARYTQSMGVRAGINLDKALQLASAIEDEEIVRKLIMRK